jgi:acyl-CoA thioester hydrolase
MWHETEIRVRYAETDKMGIVHHSNYFIWFELGRSELCRSKGFSYRDMEDKDNALLVVAESYCRYKAPTYYEDVLVIKTQVAKIRSRSIVFVYEIFRPSDATVVAEGETLHIVVNRENKICTLPDQYREMLIAEEETKAMFPPDEPPH